MPQHAEYLSDPRAEELACCGLMRAPDLLFARAGKLCPSDFTRPRPRAVAYVVLPAARMGEPTDPVSVLLALSASPQFFCDFESESDCEDYLSAILALDPTGLWAQPALRRVEHLARRREAVHEYRRLARAALDGSDGFAPDDAESLTGLSLEVTDGF